MESASLWTEWDFLSKTVLLPDEKDTVAGARAIMSVSMKNYAGIYFGYFKPFIPHEKIWSELIISRDGKTFDRLHEIVVDAGPDGSWDSRQSWASAGWVEMEDEWWIYYFGSNNNPNIVLKDDEGFNIGVAKIRKEGFLSLAVPEVGGMVVTKLVTWPGGDLLVNCDVPKGEMRVRVSDRKRDGLAGFDFADSVPFTGNRVAQRVSWKEGSIGSLKGKEIRLEFFFSNAADLYGFRATGVRGAAAPTSD